MLLASSSLTCVATCAWNAQLHKHAPAYPQCHLYIQGCCIWRIRSDGLSRVGLLVFRSHKACRGLWVGGRRFSFQLPLRLSPLFKPFIICLIVLCRPASFSCSLALSAFQWSFASLPLPAFWFGWFGHVKTSSPHLAISPHAYDPCGCDCMPASHSLRLPDQGCAWRSRGGFQRWRS